jgi:flavin-binding protein dodecin
MSDNVYKKIEIVGTSTTSLEDAIQNAVGKAAQTVRRMGWFEVEEVRGAIKKGQVTQWQVSVKIGFTLED